MTFNAIIASRIYAPETAAASFRLRALARAIGGEGGKVTVLTSDLPPGVNEVAHGPNIEVKRAKVLRDADRYVRGYAQYMSFDIPLFFRLLLAKRPDVVICEPPPTTGFFTRIACGLRRIPYVYYAADIWADAAESSAPAWVVRILRGVENWAMRGASEIVTVSDAVRDRLVKLGHRHVSVAENGVDTDVFTTNGPVHESDRPYFVYAGTASEWQGAEIFAEAMKIVNSHHPEAQLVYLGQGTSTADIGRIAAELPSGTITQHGRVDAETAAAWQRGAVSALVSIKPDLGYDFAKPTKVYSALATGTPVIYAGPGPLRTPIASEKLGMVVEYDVEEVAHAMIDTLESEPAPNEKKRRHDWVEANHSLTKTGREALTAIKKALN